MLRRLTACLLTIGVVIISFSSMASQAAPLSQQRNTRRELKKLAPELETATSGTIRVIVQTKGHPTAAQEHALAERGGIKRRSLSVLDAFVADVPAGALAAIAAREDVAYISPDRPVRAQMDVTRETTGASLAQAGLGHAPGATGRGIGIAIIDSGISAAHPDFQSQGRSRVVASVDFTQTSATASDEGGHGTGVAGVAAGNGAASRGYAGNYTGIAPAADIINLKVLNRNGVGTTSAALEAIGWAIANQKRFNIRIVNLSLGAPVL